MKFKVGDKIINTSSRDLLYQVTSITKHSYLLSELPGNCGVDTGQFPIEFVDDFFVKIPGRNTKLGKILYK